MPYLLLQFFIGMWLGFVSDSNQTIIIKKVKKVSGDGHHGGAWKVAYADFVTAMMAFFLLMWLLNATTEDQRKGIADYFNPTIPMSPISGGGADLLNGSSVFSDDTLAKDGRGGAKSMQSAGQKKKEPTSERDKIAEQNASLEALYRELTEQIEGDETGGLARHIQMHVTPEGLVIELVDADDNPLYQKGSATASATMKLLLTVVTNALNFLDNDISIVGHTDGLPYAGAENYSNWELSTDRANMARRLMIDSGFPIAQIDEVAGKADTEPLVENILAPQNRRISITILKS